MQTGRCMHTGRQGCVRGFTLIEMMVTLAVVAVGLALAIPSYENIHQRREATAEAEELASFLAYAQGDAIKSNRQVSVQLSYTSSTNWCIGAAQGNSGCDCTEADESQADFCSLSGIHHVMDNSDFDRSGMNAHSADTLFVYDPIRGIKSVGDLADHSYTIQSSNGNWALQVSVSPTGRIRLCNPDSAKAVPGFELCTTLSIPPIIILPPLG